MFPDFGIGNGNANQFCQPNVEMNWLMSIGKKLGTGIPAYAWVQMYNGTNIQLYKCTTVQTHKYTTAQT